ncbi:MAG: hypothetical protein K0S88_2000, partial [Actinomycetia bacterium]|nr:hypothetical protein [Actinomycetes bacterium]
HRQASSRSRIDGRAARRLAGPRHPATGPPIWAGRRVPARPRPGQAINTATRVPENHELEGDDA